MLFTYGCKQWKRQLPNGSWLLGEYVQFVHDEVLIKMETNRFTSQTFTLLDVMMDYELKYTEDGEVITCDCCDYPALVATFTTGRETAEFCEVCSSTFLSKAHTYPEQVSDVSLYKSIGWIANHLKDQI